MSIKFKTSVKPLQWAHVSGKGSAKYGKDFTSENPLDFEYKATIIIDKVEAKTVQKVINDFWAENKPAKIVKPTSTFLKPELTEGKDKDEYGAAIKVETGNFSISASTNAAFKNSKDPANPKPTKITLLRANGEKFPATHPLVLGDVGIGEGSKGIIHGTLAVTEYEGKAYIKFYLSGIQFAKFVPYEGSSIDAEAIGSEEEDDGCGVDTDGCDVENIADTNQGPAL
jgi:hypothetical protein